VSASTPSPKSRQRGVKQVPATKPARPNPPPNEEGKKAPDGLPVFAFAAGLFFFVTIVKFSCPMVMDRIIETPADLSSFVYELWPPHWGAWLSLPVALTGLWALQGGRANTRWVVFLPLIWFGWELISASRTINRELTELTMTHFAVCVGLFYLGLFARKGMDNPWPIWAGMGLALCWAMRTGMQQHFGGLEATRKMVQESPGLFGVTPQMLADPAYLKRIASDRIFGTFAGYPNGLAGGVILFLPLTLAFLWRLTPKVRDPIRIAFVLILGGCGLACLYWSGSKAGWLVALVVGLVALGHSALPVGWRRALIAGILVIGLVGFGVKYSAYFKKEQNSVGARFAYWRAALIVTDHHPVLGTGPGTFRIPYSELRRPTDEPTKLCHNDYLEQASDSGLPGFISYLLMILAVLFELYRYRKKETGPNWLDFSVFLGVLGVCMHSWVEYHLYVPAIAWPMFFMMGWLMWHQD
jgi:hypothetical protein